MLKFLFIFTPVFFILFVSCSDGESPANVQNNEAETNSSSEVSKAEELNKLGYAKYKEKKYQEAADYYRQAIEEDPENAKSHYNLSCMLSLNNEYCNYDDREALSALETSIRLNPGYKKAAMTDGDLKNLRKFFKFRKLIGSIKSDADIVSYLKEVKSHKDCYSAGVYEFCTTYTFHGDGSYSIEKQVPSQEPDDSSGAPYAVTKTSKGNFSVENGKIIFNQTEPENKTEKKDAEEFFHPEIEDRCSA
ncbi:MAG: tetratricopeptide repeat protein [Spirochaetia bacterium]|nr:tetratricopeptide repeat protein [Spirochaetia bacterium]